MGKTTGTHASIAVKVVLICVALTIFYSLVLESRGKPEFTLAANGQHPDFIPRNDKPVQGNVTRSSVGNDQLTDLAFPSPTQQRVMRKVINCGGYGLDSICRRARTFAAQKFKSTLQMSECARRIDYRRHGLGLATGPPLARRSIQACTSWAP